VSLRSLVRKAFVLAIFVVIAAFLYVVATVVQVLLASKSSQVPSAVPVSAAIVVLGPPGSNGATGSVVNRLEQGLTLFQAKRAPMIIVTGTSTASGGGSTGPSELKSEVKFLEQQGLQAKYIRQVTGTDDSTVLTAVARIVGRADGGRVIIVSDPLSSLRLRGTASSAGLTAEISPGTPPSTGFLTDVGHVWTQALAVAEGRVLGWGSSGWAST
jgi:uncharacterized SAM-binding protein YcdF (DUF218 family)